MDAPRFDRLYPYAELTEVVHGLAAAHPALMQVESIGRSHEGRDIWLATITNLATGLSASPLTHHEVTVVADRGAVGLRAILEEYLGSEAAR